MHDEDIPAGLCQCGCGRATAIAKRTYGDRVKKGEPYRFVTGHYRRIVTPVAERLRRHIEIDAHGCWNWMANRLPSGYGLMNDGTGRARYTHRLAYEAFVGPIPDGLQIDHLCRNPRCCNPDHLEAVTGRENLLRGTGFAAINAAKTRCVHGHEFTAANTILTDHGRGCRECKRAGDRRRYHARKATAREIQTQAAL